MAKIEVLNLNELVDEITSSNINVTAANQAVVDATTKASEASARAGSASLSADLAAQSVLDTRNEALRAEAAVISAENQVTLAETKTAEALDSAALAESARVTAEQHRDTSLDVLAQVEQVYDNFDDRYLGGHSSDPIVDNDGDDIVDGALYWNTTDKIVKVFSQAALAWSPISDANGSLLIANNLDDIIDVAAARTNLDVLSSSEVVTEIADQLNAQKGAINGIAELDGAGLVPSSQLPSYVDDVIEVATYADLPVTGESGKIYIVVTDETSDGNTTSYRWTGSVYALISNTLSGADVKALYEGEADTNAYTDAEKVLVSVGTPLDTTSATLPGAINELDAELAAQDGRLGTLESDVDTAGSVLNVVRETGADATYDGSTSGLAATKIKAAIDELDEMVDTNAANIAVIVDAMAGLSDASGSASSSVEVNIPIDGSLLAVSGYTVKTQSTDTDVFELDGATGKVIIKTPGKYSFVMTFYAKALDKDPTITPRIVINSNAGIVYDDTLGLIKVKKDGIIFPTNVLIEVTEGMLAGGDLELDMEIGHVESVNADRQVAVTGFDAVISTMGGVYSGFADHGQLTGATDADSHPASAISVVPQGNLSSNSVQLALEEHQVDIDELRSITGTTSENRYDKLLAVRDVIAMDYTSGDLDYVRYEGDDDATVYYRDVMTYVGGNLVQVDHFYETADLVTASGQTVLTYDVDDNLVTATYTE
jgi:hypothetical protein